MDVIVPFLLAFGMIIVTELGDKTQLMTISLASRYSRRTVFLGAMLGMGLVAVIGVVIGLLLGAAFDAFWVKIIAAVIFIAFGAWTLIKREEVQETKEIPDQRVLAQSFFLLFLAELGDKTQIAVIALTATYSETFGGPVAILVGALLGFSVIVAVGVLIGKEIGKRVAPKWIVLVSGVLFIVIGVIVAIEAFLGE